jgi:hypothetical protein
MAVILGCVLGMAAAAARSWAADPSPEDDLYPHRRGRHIVFSLHSPRTATVSLIGDFNDWQEEATPLQYVGSGVWEAAVRLPEGMCDYKFVVDGKKLLDPSNPEEATASDGSVHSRIRVLPDGRVSHFSWNTRRREALPTRVTLEPRAGSRLTLGGDYSYQRVDGSSIWLTAGYISNVPYVPEASLRFGYGFESESPTLEADFSQPLVPSRALAIGITYVDGTGYENQSGIGWRENTLFALLFKHDYNDYYSIQGMEPYVRVRFPGGNTLRVSYAVEEYDSLVTQTDWSLFEAGSDRFRPNPPLFLLNEPGGLGGSGRLQATRVEFIHDTLRAHQVGGVGGYVRGFLELGGGDFSYARWIGDGRAYMRLGPAGHVAARFRAGGRFGNDEIPSQKLFYIGGLGTVRGHEFRSLYGDSEILGNFEYTYLFWDLRYGALLFYDAGTAWNSSAGPLSDATALQSVGFGLKTADNDFQLTFAKPVGGIAGDWETVVRLNRTF